ncbi:MAG TPA: hypothetical protein VEU30_06460 [Thermoanaerobaculia bacterium]|nr:hypothetical protein [Thermoanaerobaculia bacterium]
MRVRAIALALLLAGGIHAQTVDPFEQTYGPYTPGVRDRTIALSATPQGILLAWTEVVEPGTQQSEIHTGMLDFDAKLTGPIRRIAPSRPGVPMTNPAIGTDFNGFFISWAELSPVNYDPKSIAGVITDPFGHPVSPVRRYGPWLTGQPQVIFNGIEYRLYGEQTYLIAPDGSVIDRRGGGMNRIPFATPEANGWVDWRGTIQFGTGRRPLLELGTTVLTYDDDHRDSFDVRNAFGPPAVFAEGRDVLIVWGSDTGLGAVRILDGVRGRAFAYEDPAARGAEPAVAGNLVVYQNDDGDIYGSVLTANAFGTPFPISTGSDWDTTPRVLAVGYGRYLVAYVREHGNGQVSLAGRFVTIH